jgi:ribosome-binding protein aMBF1 (putative translation factor)
MTPARRADVAELVAALLAGLDLATLAERAHVHPSLVADVATGRLRPSPELRRQLAAALGTEAVRLVE